MGFTLGKNTYIVNEPSQLDGYITENTGDTDSDKLMLPGIVTVRAGRITDAKKIGTISAVQGSLEFTPPSADLLGVKQSFERESGVSVKIVIDSTRTAGDWSNNSIEMSRPIVVGITVNPGDSADTVAAAIREAYAALDGEYVIADLPFEVIPPTDAKIELKIKEGYEYLNFEALVEFTIDNNTIRKVIGTITKSVEPAYTGAQLEEFVRMSLNDTSDLYSIKAGQLPVLGAMYNYVEFTAADSWTDSGIDARYQMHKGLGGTRDEASNIRYHTFMLFFKQDGGPVDGIYNDIGDWLLNTPNLP